VFRSSKSELIRHHRINQTLAIVHKEIIRQQECISKHGLPPVNVVSGELKCWAETTEAILIGDPNIARDELAAMCEVTDLLDTFLQMQQKKNYPVFRLNLLDVGGGRVPIAQALLQKRIAKQWAHEELMCFCFNIQNLTVDEENVPEKSQDGGG
jgi:hypothetical protein